MDHAVDRLCHVPYVDWFFATNDALEPIWEDGRIVAGSGAAGDAAALAIAGFTWGGWVTSSTAQTMAATASNNSAVAAMMPHCLARAESDPEASIILAELKEACVINRRTIVEKAG